MHFTGTFLLLARVLPLALVGFSNLAYADSIGSNDLSNGNQAPQLPLSDIPGGFLSGNAAPSSAEFGQESKLQMRSAEQDLESLLAKAIYGRDISYDDDDGDDVDDDKQASILADDFACKIFGGNNCAGSHAKRSIDAFQAVLKRDFYDALDEDDLDKAAFIGKIFAKIKGMFSSKNKGSSRSDPNGGGPARPDSPILGPYSSTHLKRSMGELHSVLRRDFLDALEEDDFDKAAFIGKIFAKIKGMFSSKNKGSSRSDPNGGGPARPDSPTLGPYSSTHLKRAVQDVEALVRSELLAAFGDSTETKDIIDGVVRKVQAALVV
ncbi:hypothetical protein BJ508DRAFT_412045 [Ascobolus immersus RN42]|uniref:Uncharacterized protein n=1 Tax=Ascobolus immersus RN42 TaxID=1160509 RepID=A0A3N4IKP2_ASCIM|nr:hypothetical protein BJ508DRAFT_412045 [Ascobolus immersus RN42]